MTAKSRYRELEQVAEAVTRLDPEAGGLAGAVRQLRGQAKRALEYKEQPRNPNLETARAKGAAVMKERAATFRTQILISIAEFPAGMSLRDVAKKLNDNGIKTLRGGKWSAATVSRFLNKD